MDPFPHYQNGCLGAVFDLELAEKRFQMSFNGFSGNIGNLADFFVVEPFCH